MHPRQIVWPFIGLFVALAPILAACGSAPAPAGPATAATQPPTAAPAAGAATPQQSQDATKVTVWTHSGTAEEAALTCDCATGSDEVATGGPAVATASEVSFERVKI